MKRHYFVSDNLKLSYLDSGGNAPILLALHAHWMQAADFVPLANALMPEWRVIALDQRGHGFSEHASSYTRADYLRDLAEFFRHLNIDTPIVLLGNSLGGINSYQFAAQYPHLVHAMIIEDIGVMVDVDVTFSLAWKGVFKTKQELEEKIGPRFLPYLKNSICETAAGWKLMFDPEELLISNNNSCGDYWQDWLATDCPCLILKGKDSRVTDQKQLEEMSIRRMNTRLEILDGGHVVHTDNPVEFNRAVKNFLQIL